MLFSVEICSPVAAGVEVTLLSLFVSSFQRLEKEDLPCVDVRFSSGLNTRGGHVKSRATR